MSFESLQLSFFLREGLQLDLIQDYVMSWYKN